MRRILRAFKKATISFLQIYLAIELIILAKAISVIDFGSIFQEIIPFSFFLFLILFPIYITLLIYYVHKSRVKYIYSRRYIII